MVIVTVYYVEQYMSACIESLDLRLYIICVYAFVCKVNILSQLGQTYMGRPIGLFN